MISSKKSANPGTFFSVTLSPMSLSMHIFPSHMVINTHKESETHAAFHNRSGAGTVGGFWWSGSLPSLPLFRGTPNLNKEKKQNWHVCANDVSQWNMVHVRYARDWFALDMAISYCLSPFCWQWVPNVNVVPDGIWALHLFEFEKNSTELFIDVADIGTLHLFSFKSILKIS